MSNSQPESCLQQIAIIPIEQERRTVRVYCLLAAALLVLFGATSGLAIPLSEYRDHVKQAIASLDLLAEAEAEDGLSEAQRAEFVTAQIRIVREALPRTQLVEWQGTRFPTDNSWLDNDLKLLPGMPVSDANRAPLLARIRERLLALHDRLEESEKGAGSLVSTDELQGRLAAILQRPEYAREVQQRSALDQLLRRLVAWINKLLPQSTRLTPGGANILTKVVEVIVIGLAAVVIFFCIRLAAPRLFGNRRPKKKSKAEARVVLGERLEPDQSGADLLAEAESLARAGDLRGAIRKGYIALLVELGDRKVISLAQYKTNRDYLRSVRELEKLYGSMLKLTGSFELHWYGRVQASETDWTAFRAFYHEALR